MPRFELLRAVKAGIPHLTNEEKWQLHGQLFNYVAWFDGTYEPDETDALDLDPPDVDGLLAELRDNANILLDLIEGHVPEFDPTEYTKDSV